MGSLCSTCFGSSESNNETGAKHHRHHTGRGTETPEERAQKRERMGHAAEDRLQTRGGDGALSKKLAEQGKHPATLHTGSSDAPLQRVEELLAEAGFEHKLPQSSTAFAGGDGNAVEVSPIGYYRFHFWKNDEQWREHENWIANTDMTGPMCISLIEDQQGLSKRTFYRLLIRSIFGTKSVILFDEDLAGLQLQTSSGKSKKVFSRTVIIGAGLRAYLEHEKENMMAMEDEFGAMSIRTACTITSVADDLVRLLPSSRLREAGSTVSSELESSPALSRNLSRRISHRGSVSLSPLDGSVEDDLTPMGFDYNFSDIAGTLVSPPQRAGSLRKRFNEISRINPFELAKSFTLVKEKGLYAVLQNLESALGPRICHFDLVIIDGSTAKEMQKQDTWDAFSGLLGKKLTKSVFQQQSILLSKQGRVPSDVMEKLVGNETMASLKGAPQFLSEDVTEDKQKLHVRRVAEFVENEVNYLNRLRVINEYFFEPLAPSGPLKVMGKEDFNRIFEGFDLLFVLHERIVGEFLEKLGLSSGSVILPRIEEKVLAGGFSAHDIAHKLITMCKEKQLYVYSQFLSDFNERRKLVKELYDRNTPFRVQVDLAAEDPRAKRSTLPDVMANIFQHITRYPLQLEQIIKTTHHQDPTAPTLLRAYDDMRRLLVNLEIISSRHSDTSEVFRIQRKLLNCPPELCSAQRSFVAKMAAYEVERGEANFSKRLTIFLFNDMVLGARKRRAQQGRLDRDTVADRKESTQPTHEFLFSCPIGGMDIKRLEGRVKACKKQCTPFVIDLGRSQGHVWHENRQVALSQCAEDVKSNFVLAPKRQEKLSVFLEHFSRHQHESYLSDSPAEVYWRREEESGQNIYFHVFRQQDYEDWSHKNRISILYAHQAPIRNLYGLFPEDSTNALVVVQALQGSFRWLVRSRDCIVASQDCFEAQREFRSASSVEPTMLKALLNCHLVHHIYPPFGPQLDQQMHQQLLHHIEPFSRGIFRRFRALVSKMQKTVEASALIVDDGASTFSVEMPSIGNSEHKASGGRKKTVFGKMFGRFKSPLAKNLEDIPE